MDLWVVKYASRAIHRSDAPGYGAFWPLTRVQAKGCCRIRELDRMGGDSRPGSGHLEPVGQAEMGEDRGDHGRMFDGGDDRQGTAALRTLRDVGIEYPLEQLGKAQARRRPGMRRVSVNRLVSVR